MNRCIERWRKHHPRQAQWGWFAALWAGGFTAMLAISGVFKGLFYVLR